MKVGILTFHRSYNYGAFMQCYSLTRRLQKDFPQIQFEVIDYNSRQVLIQYEKSLNSIKNDRIRQLVAKRNQSFSRCQEQLPLSNFKLVSDDYAELISYMNDNYDAVIVGSDAVWNWITRGFPNAYFLKDYKGIKLSYAASVHGMVYQNMTEEQKRYLKEAFEDFRYIGVRDSATENMVHFVCPDLPVYHNCDPTVLLDLNDVPCDMVALKRKMEASGVDFSKPLIGIMAGNSIGYEIKKYFKHRAQLIAVYEPNSNADVYLYDLTPYEWAHVFSFFRTTATHFFHGTLLTLVNHKPVTSVEFESAYSAASITKINDVLSRLALSKWRFSADYRKFSRIKKEMISRHIWPDKQLWTSVNQHINDTIQNDYSTLIAERMAEEAKSYLSFKNALENIQKEF